MPYIDYINDALAERERLKQQQLKEEYIAMQDAGKLSLEDAEAGQAIREDIGAKLQNIPVPSYQQYLGAVKNEDQAGLPSFQQYQDYWVEGKSPEKVVRSTPEQAAPAPAAVAEMAAATPIQAAVRQQQAPAQPQRPMTIGEQIEMLPFAGDRYEAKRKVMESAKRAKINEAYAYADAVYNGVATVEGGRFIENTLKQIDANFVVPKPIEETEDFQIAKEALVKGKHADRLFMLAQTKQQLEAAKQMKTKEEKVSFLETNLPKLIQSIAAGPDAIQPAEASRLMPELNSVWQSPGQAFELIGRKGIYDAFAKQPDVFIEKLGKIYNATIPGVNERTASYHENLGSAFKKLGVGYITPVGAKNRGIDMTRLQQLREGTEVQQPVFSQTNPADRPASTGPQIVPGMRGVVTPGSFTYGSKPMQLGF